MKVVIEFPDSQRHVQHLEFDTEIELLDYVKECSRVFDERVRFQAETAQFGVIIEPPSDEQEG